MIFNITTAIKILLVTFIFSVTVNLGATQGNEHNQIFNVLSNKEQKNTYFGVSPSNFPEIGQTFQLKNAMQVQRVEIKPTMISRAKSINYFIDENYSLDAVENKFRDKPIKVTTTLTIYKWQAQGLPPEIFDLSDGFTQIHKQNYKKSIVLGKPYELKLNKKVRLDKGIYLVVFGMNFPDKRILEVRFAGQQNGTNTMGGYNHDQPFNCNYKKTKDKTPGFMVYSTNSFDRPKTGEFPGTVGFGSTFKKSLTKITECAKLGVYGDENMIWNPGDLDLSLYSY